MRNLLVVSVVAALGAAAACSSNSSSRQLSASDARDVLIDRNWIDRMPETTTDRLHVYRFVPNMGGGVYQDRTLFKGTFELFMFKVERGNHIVFDLPETGEKVTSEFQIETVDGPAPFDLKLTIASDPRGPHTYYGMRAETDRDGHLLEEKLAARRAATH
ncbi:MAG TPA: hypothetical protein VFK02_12980 [Kofleriaceae bacterium]|nr:hypothetical protein [Kofleriaceae bacterium]